MLLLDEITVDLDVLGRADLMNYLRAESEERGACIVYATVSAPFSRHHRVLSSLGPQGNRTLLTCIVYKPTVSVQYFVSSPLSLSYRFFRMKAAKDPTLKKLLPYQLIEGTVFNLLALSFSTPQGRKSAIGIQMWI